MTKVLVFAILFMNTLPSFAGGNFGICMKQSLNNLLGRGAKEEKILSEDALMNELASNLKLDKYSKSLALKNGKLRKRDLDEMRHSDQLSRFEFDSFEDGHFIPEIVQSVTDATNKEMKFMKRAMKKSLKRARPEKIEEIDMYVEFALTRPKEEAIQLFLNINKNLNDFKNPITKLTKENRGAKKALARFQRLKNKSAISKAHAFDEQSEWLKCLSPRYQLKRQDGYNGFLKSVPKIELAVIPVAASLANLSKGDDAEFGLDFAATVVNELLFAYFVLPKAIGASRPFLMAAKGLKSKLGSKVGEAGVFYTSGLVMGYLKGLAMEQINKLPYLEKDKALAAFDSEKMQTQLKKAADQIVEMENNMTQDEVLESMGMKTESEKESFIQGATEMNEGLEKFTLNGFKKEYWDDADMSVKTAAADSSFALVNSFKIAMISNSLAPFFCMANSPHLPLNIQKKYRNRGAGAFAAQSAATGVLFFMNRDMFLSI
jgi:hypothetical protein